MKKIILPLGLITFVTALLLSVNVSLKKDVQDEIFMSAIALAQGEGEGGSSTEWTCYSTYNTCGWWGGFWGTCDTLYRCGNPCASTEGTDLKDPGKCTPPSST